MDSNNSASVPLQQTSNPMFKIPVFLSYATPFNDLQTEFLNRTVNEIEENLLFPRTLGVSDQYTETPVASIRRMMLSSYGCLAIAFRRALVIQAISRPGSPGQAVFENFWLSSPFLQIEPAMAFERGLPLMILVEDGVSMNGVFGGMLERGETPFIILTFSLLNEQSIVNFFNSTSWKEAFLDWVGEVRSGYTLQTEPEFKFV